MECNAVLWYMKSVNMFQKKHIQQQCVLQFYVHVQFVRFCGFYLKNMVESIVIRLLRHRNSSP